MSNIILHVTTRNSAVADKPRDAFLQYVMACLTLKTPYPMCYDVEYGVSRQTVWALLEGPPKFGCSEVSPWDGTCLTVYKQAALVRGLP